MISADKAAQGPLVLILVASFLLRVAGVHFGLPHLYHQDEPIVVNHALAYALGDFNPHFFKIPPLLSALLFLVYGVFYSFLAIFGHFSKEMFAELFFRDPGIFYLIGRLVFGAAAGTATVWALYALTKKMLDRRTALLSAALLASSFLHARDSHYLYADIPMTFCVVMVFYELEKKRRKESRFSWLPSLWAGAAIAFKYIALPVALPILADDILEKRGAGAVFRSLFLVGIFYLALNPFSLIDFNFFITEIRSQARVEVSPPFFHHLLYSLGEGQGLPAVFAGLYGLPLLAADRRRVPFVSFAVGYYFLIAFFSQPYERYAIPVLPFLCVSAAFFVTRVIPRPRLQVAIGFLLVLTPLAKALYLDSTLFKEDTRTQAKVWMERSLPEGAAVVLDHPFFSPRLIQPEDQLTEKLAQIRPEDPHQREKAERIKFMKRLAAGQKRFHVTYVDFDRLASAPFLMSSPLVVPDAEAVRRIKAQYYVRYRYPGENDFFERQVSSEARLVKVFSPYQDPSRIFNRDTWSNVALPFSTKELFSRERQGPYLEIYRLETR
ncbi:MAG: glycosyltransferase family 39 protein [Candidatus Omnitrophica bacterium]|nr:glycosyltransferase family 39 protein [Candidatus Omnitrophota bacterium]